MGNFLNRLQWKFVNFMQGRYGSDPLSTTLSVIDIILIIIYMFTYITVLWFLAIVIIVVIMFRTFSKNIPARQRECEAYLRLIGRPKRSFMHISTAWKNRKTTLYFKCEGCKTRLSVPRGKGRIRITCPKCGRQTIRKS